MNQQLNFDLNTSGFLAVLPYPSRLLSFVFIMIDVFRYVGLFIVGVASGKVADSLVKSGVDLTLVRKMFGVLGTALPAFFLIGLSFVSCSHSSLQIFENVFYHSYISQVQAAVTCMVLAVSLSGFNYCSYGPNMLDIAPKYAGIILGYPFPQFHSFH